MTGRRIRAGIIVVTAVAVAALALWGVWPRSGPLARFARHFQPKQYGIPAAWDHRYWLNDREQILVYYSRVNIARLGESPRWKFMSEASAINMETGGESHLNPLNARLVHEQSAGHGIWPLCWKLSPDGKWIVFVKGSRPARYVAIATDGSRFLEWPARPGLPMIQWFPDSRRWVGFDYYSYPTTRAAGHLYDITAPDKTISLPRIDWYVRELGVTREDRLLVVAGFDSRRLEFNPGQSVELMELDFMDSKMPVATHTIDPPHAGAVKYMALSSQGDRLAWLVSVHQSAPRIPFLQKALAVLGIRDRDMLSLYVSRIDGGDMREVGYLDWDPKSGAGALAWAPDNRHVSFWVADGIGELWVVPVD